MPWAAMEARLKWNESLGERNGHASCHSRSVPSAFQALRAARSSNVPCSRQPAATVAAIVRRMPPIQLDLSTAARLGDPWMERCGDVARAYHLLSHWEAPDESQAEVRRRMLEFVERHPTDAHLRALAEGHLTASALVVDAKLERALLTHHRKLGRWLQLGGHCDGDANLAAVALRESVEESGIPDLVVLPAPIDLDIHPIPARPDEPEHLHYDARFLVVAPPGAVEVASEESHELRWVAPGELGALATDDSVRRLFRRVFGA